MRNVIYLRTSTDDQHPENQLQACTAFVRQRGYAINENRDIYIEHASAWKDSEKRTKYHELRTLAHKGELASITVWALDRWVRNYDTMLEDVAYFAERNVKLHSVKEEWIESINIPGAIGRAVSAFLLGLIAAKAEAESSRQSQRVRAGMDRVKKEGKLYHRPKKRFNKHRAKHLLERGMPMRAVAQEVGVSAATIYRFKRECEK